MAYTTFDQLFQDLYAKNSQLNYNDFNSSTLSGLSASINNIWKDMLDKIILSPQGPFLSDEFGQDTVFEHIDASIDFNSTLTDYLGDSGNQFWNESICQLASDFNGSFGDNATLYGSVKVEDLKNADAGNSFRWEYSAYTTWVVPWKNKSGKSYQQERNRGYDVIKAVIEYSDNLDFTNEKGNWIRLLMPRYLRYVEVEDLNRNFWVISEVLTGICEFIFGNKLKPLLDSILNELIQLWQNTQYLWATYAVLSQDPFYKDVHYEVVPVPVDDLRNYVKFDDFDNSSRTGLTALQYAQGQLRYLFSQYSESNLCIVPYFRMNNYSHNYYYSEYYPGVILYDRNLNRTYLYYFADTNNISINPLLYEDKIDAYDVENEFYVTNFSGAGSVTPSGMNPYGMLRVVPVSLNATYDESFTGLTMTLRVYDVAHEVVGEGKRLVATWVLTMQSQHMSQPVQSIDQYVTHNIEPALGPSTATTKKPVKGFYLGELASSPCDTIPFVVTNYCVISYAATDLNNPNGATWSYVAFSQTEVNEEFQGISDNRGECNGNLIGSQGNVYNRYYGETGEALKIYYFKDRPSSSEIEGVTSQETLESQFKKYAKWLKRGKPAVDEDSQRLFQQIETYLADSTKIKYFTFRIGQFLDNDTLREGMEIIDSNIDLGTLHTGDILFPETDQDYGDFYIHYLIRDGKSYFQFTLKEWND